MRRRPGTSSISWWPNPFGSESSRQGPDNEASDHPLHSIALVLGWWRCLVCVATGAETDFYRDVYPALKSNCIACHNKTTTKASLNMETPEAMHKGGDSGEGVIPGNGAESLVVQAAAHVGDDIEMPPRQEQQDGREWISRPPNSRC